MNKELEKISNYELLDIYQTILDYINQLKVEIEKVNTND